MALRFTFNGSPWEVSDFGIDLQSLVIDMGNTLTAKFGANLFAVSANPPGAPSNLNAIASSLTVVSVTWAPSQNHEATYVLYRSADGVTYAQIATMVNTLYSHSDDIDSTVEHWYKLIARNHFGDSDPIIFHYVPSGSAPAAPSLLAAVAHGTSQIDLVWMDNANNETGFKIERSPASAETWVEIDTTTTNLTTYQNTGLAAGTAYDYRVRAYNAFGNSSYSNTATATTDSNPATPPAAPSNPTATALNSHAIRVGWTDNSTDETGFEVHWSDTQNGTYVLLTTTNANLQLYDNDGLNPQQTRWYKIRAVNGAGASAFTSPSVSATTPSAAVNILPDLVAAAIAKADANTSQWQTFNSTWSANLNAFITGGYESFQATYSAHQALRYQCLKTSNPTEAAKSAKKVMAILRSLINEYASSTSGYLVGYQYLGRGDGTTRIFNLPNTPIATNNIGTIQVKLCTLVHKAVVKGAANGQDTVADQSKFIKVSNTSDGAADYAEGVDWRHNGDYANALIDWSLGGLEPTTGATYYVTHAVLWPQAVLAPSSYALVGNVLTFNVAPATTQAIFVQYMYADYAQTLSDGGGYNAMLVDSGYGSRYLASAAIAYDWIYEYSGFDSALKTAFEDVLIKWCARAYSGAYQAGHLSSNYGAGHYLLLCCAACALEGTRPEAATILNNALSVRSVSIQPDILEDPGVNKHCSYQGGFYGEGWSYGGLAVANVIDAANVLYQSGHLSAPEFLKERQWATSVVKCLLSGKIDMNHQFNAGDWQSYMLANVPARDDLFAPLTNIPDDATARQYAQYMLNHQTGSFSSSYRNFLYYDPTATEANWTSAEPLAYIALGTGCVYSRADWTYGSTFVTLQCGNTPNAGHLCDNVGNIQIWRGIDDLSIYASQFANSTLYVNRSAHGNMIVIDDGGAGQQINRFAQATNEYGPAPGCKITLYDVSQSGYAYAKMDGTKAWYKDTTHNSCLEWTRFWLHVRPDYLFVFDRVTTKSAAYTMRLQNSGKTTITPFGTNGFSITVGTSKLFEQRYSNRALTSSVILWGTTVNHSISDPTVQDSPTIRYATVHQAAPSSTPAIDGNEYITSSGWEGIRIGTSCAMFPTSDSPGNPNYSLTQSGDTVHHVCGLTPSQSYTLGGDASGTVSATAAGVLGFTVTGSGAKTVTVT